MRQIAFAVLTVLLPVCLLAEERGPVYRAESYGVRNLIPPHAVAAAAAAPPEVVLAEPTNLRLGGDPAIVGVVRPLIAVSADRPAPRSFRSKGAARVRLHLTNVSLPHGGVAWVSGAGGEAIPFGAELLHDGAIWTPSVEGDTVALTLPFGARAEVAAIGHVAVHEVRSNADECFLDATCYKGSPDVEQLSRATALLMFVNGGNIGQCTGGLINGADGDRQLLTANHCISTAAAAASLEAVWDFKSTTCGGARGASPRTNGAQLLVTTPLSDTTLLRLSSLPSGRWLMGWSTGAVPAGQLLYRVANPAVPNSTNVYLQTYSVTAMITSGSTCPALPRPNFIYSSKVSGGVGPGSSGAPVIKAGGYIVGQLLGGCSIAGQPDGCSALTYSVDGSLAAAYPYLQPFINPATTPACVANSTTACLLGERFRVSIAYRNQFANPPATGNFLGARLLQGNQNPDTALFGFSSAQAVEVIVRVQDARPFAPRFDIYYGGMTDVEYTVTVTDTVKGTSRTYRNAPGTVGGGVDRTSFPAN